LKVKYIKLNIGGFLILMVCESDDTLSVRGPFQQIELIVLLPIHDDPEDVEYMKIRQRIPIRIAKITVFELFASD
jgi:hypothetical protein